MSLSFEVKGFCCSLLGLPESLKAQELVTGLCGDFLDQGVVQWLKLHIPGAGFPGSIPDQGSRSHIQQLRAQMLQFKSPRATANAWCSLFFFFDD